MRPPARWRRKALLLSLAVAATLNALLVSEGVLSLFFGRSLRPRPFDELRGAMAERARLADGDEAELWPHPDPNVGYVFRPDSSGRILGAEFRIDERGTRARRDAPPVADAVRVLICGDSVAFGAGVGDDQTLAAALEQLLEVARGPGERPVRADTAALPGWNARNAIAFALHHLDDYSPDAIVYLPVPNDLADTYSVGPAGSRTTGFDPASRTPLLSAHDEPIHLLLFDLASRIRRKEASSDVARGEEGVFALAAGLTPESRARYDENAQWVERLDRAARARGAVLFLLFFSEMEGGNGYSLLLRERLLERGADIAVIPGLVEMRREFTLGADPHPNPTAIRAVARWVAEELVARGIVERARLDLDPVPSRMAELRAPRRSPHSVRSAADARRRALASRLQDRIVPATGRGVRQVLGGLNPDGTLGPTFACALAARGKSVTIRIRGLPEGLDLEGETLLVDGDVRGEIRIPPPGRETSATVQATDSGGPVVEIRLRAQRWTLSRRGDTGFPACAELVEIAAGQGESGR